MDDPMRLCSFHSDQAFKRYIAVEDANPQASVEFWAAYYEKETLRQVKAQLEHCNRG